MHKDLKPNLVLLNGGTNDCGRGTDTANAGARYKNLIDDIFNSIPGVTVVMSTVLPSRDHTQCAIDVSRQFRQLLAGYPSDKRIVVADLNSGLTLDDIGPDGIHPNDGGYRKVAAIWWDAIRRIEDRIQPPLPGIDDAASSATGGQTCPKVAGNAGPPTQTQRGSGADDGHYVHHSVAKGVLTDLKVKKGGDPVVNNAIPKRIHFAQMINVGAGRESALDDWVRVLKEDGTVKYYVRQNLGNGRFSASMEFSVDQDCNAGNPCMLPTGPMN